MQTMRSKTTRRKRNEIRCIVSDLGNVIVKNHEQRVCTGLARHSSLTAAQIQKRFIDRGAYNAIQKGKITRRQLYDTAVRRLRLSGLSQQQFERILADMLTPNVFVQKLMRELARTYKMVLLSNTDSIHYEHIRKRYPVLRLFSRHVLSYKLGVMKPLRRIYLEAARQARCEPQECVFIDDLRENAQGASKAGMHGVWYRTNRQLVSDLRAAGVKI
jgi:glucose-1-phosphatase